MENDTHPNRLSELRLGADKAISWKLLRNPDEFDNNRPYEVVFGEEAVGIERSLKGKITVSPNMNSWNDSGDAVALAPSAIGMRQKHETGDCMVNTGASSSLAAYKSVLGAFLTVGITFHPRRENSRETRCSLDLPVS